MVFEALVVISYALAGFLGFGIIFANLIDRTNPGPLTHLSQEANIVLTLAVAAVAPLAACGVACWFVSTVLRAIGVGIRDLKDAWRPSSNLPKARVAKFSAR